jgi:hypothetical protein
MSKADRLKEEVGCLKFVFTIAGVLDAALIAWLAQSYLTVSPNIVGADLLAALTLAGVGILVNRRAYRRLEDIESL